MLHGPRARPPSPSIPWTVVPRLLNAWTIDALIYPGRNIYEAIAHRRLPASLLPRKIPPRDSTLLWPNEGAAIYLVNSGGAA